MIEIIACSKRGHARTAAPVCRSSAVGDALEGLPDAGAGPGPA